MYLQFTKKERKRKNCSGNLDVNNDLKFVGIWMEEKVITVSWGIGERKKREGQREKEKSRTKKEWDWKR